MLHTIPPFNFFVLICKLHSKYITSFLNLQYILYCRLQCILQTILQHVFIFYFAILLKALEVIFMSFQLKPDKKETENKTIRFPLHLIDKIEKVIQNQDVTFSSFVLQACEYALDNMDDNTDNNTDK